MTTNPDDAPSLAAAKRGALPGQLREAKLPDTALSELVERLEAHVRYEYMPAAARLAMDQAAQALTDLSSQVETLKGAWDWLAEQVGLELDWAEIDEGDAAWRVHRVSGGRSDREWTLIATGETPLSAVLAARQALSDLERRDGAKLDRTNG